MKPRIKRDYKLGECVSGGFFITEVDSKVEYGHLRRVAIFRCKCGAEFKQFIYKVKKGKPNHCGCKIKNKIEFDKHNKVEYYLYNNIKQRCYNPKNNSYIHYGGRGIKMSDDWHNSFESFYFDLGQRPSKHHSIERVDNNGNYSKENCKWATRHEQSRNKRNNKLLTFGGKTMCVMDWATETGIEYSALQERLKNKMPLELALKNVVYSSNGKRDVIKNKHP